MFLKRRKRGLVIFFVNKIFKGTRFFNIKRRLLNRCADIQIGENTKVVGPINISNCSVLIVGDNAWIASGFTIYGDGNVSIGNNCDIAPDVAFATGSHEIGDSSRRAGKGLSYSVVVDDGCWIGARATILGNITIETGSVIGCNSLVNKQVKKNTVVAGNPSKIIRELK